MRRWRYSEKTGVLKGHPVFSGDTFTLVWDTRFDGFQLWAAADCTPEQVLENKRINERLQEWLASEGLLGSAPVQISIGRPG